MRIVGDILRWILWIYLVVIIARILIGWFPVRWPKPVRPLVVLIYDITEPVLSPLRRWIPVIPIRSGVGLDLSPTVVLILIFVLLAIVGRVFG